MPPAFVQSASNSNGGITALDVAFGSNTVAGNAIMGFCAFNDTGRTFTVTDTQGNTYGTKILSQQTGFATVELFAFVAPNIVGGADTVTFTVSGASGIIWVGIHEVNGLATASPVDQFVKCPMLN